MVLTAKLLREADYIVLDNFLPEEDYNKAKTYLYSTEPKWTLLQNVSANKEDGEIDSRVADNFGFSSILHTDGENVEKTERRQDVLDIFAQSLHKYFHIAHVLRVRAGLQTKTNNINFFHDPHVDLSYPHYTALFYFCTEDTGYGVTTIYKERHDHYHNPDKMVGWRHEDLTLADSIQPKENRVLIFKGNVLHSSSPPLDNSIRIAVNLNFIGYPREESIQDEQFV